MAENIKVLPAPKPAPQPVRTEPVKPKAAEIQKPKPAAQAPRPVRKLDITA
jgi:hypothetical protein